jgi:hypothetical protein
MKKGAWMLITMLLAGTIYYVIYCAPQTEGAGSGGGSLGGRVYGYNMYDEAIPLVWARVSAYSNNVLVESASTGANGAYVIFLPLGHVNVTVEHPGFKPQARLVVISDGGSAQMNFYLERSEIPIPEFETHLLPLMLASLLATSLALTRRRRCPKPT